MLPDLRLFEQLNEYEDKLPETFCSFLLLRFIPIEFDSTVQSIYRWQVSEFKFDRIGCLGEPFKAT